MDGRCLPELDDFDCFIIHANGMNLLKDCLFFRYSVSLVSPPIQCVFSHLDAIEKKKKKITKKCKK